MTFFQAIVNGATFQTMLSYERAVALCEWGKEDYLKLGRNFHYEIKTWILPEEELNRNYEVKQAVK